MRFCRVTSSCPISVVRACCAPIRSLSPVAQPFRPAQMPCARAQKSAYSEAEVPRGAEIENSSEDGRAQELPVVKVAMFFYFF